MSSETSKLVFLFVINLQGKIYQSFLVLVLENSDNF